MCLTSGMLADVRTHAPPILAARAFYLRRKGKKMADITIYGEIGDPDSGSDASSILEQLKKFRNKPVTLHIDSYGGSFYDGLTIHNALRQRTQHSTAEVGTMCGSAATIISCGCTHVIMPHTATYFVHRSSTITLGHAAEHRNALQWLNHCDALLTDVYVSRTRLPKKTIEQLIEGDGDGTALSAQDALQLGFIDEIAQPSTSSQRVAALRDTQADNASARRQIAEIHRQLASRQVAKLRQALADHDTRRQAAKLRKSLADHDARRQAAKTR